MNSRNAMLTTVVISCQPTVL